MKKKVLIVSASPRKEGNSDILCDEFARGAKESGHDVEKIRLAEKDVGYSTGCYACKKPGKCCKKDDANEIVEKMLSADSIVLATPVYFYSICAQLKALIDRTVVVYPNLTNKRFYYILTMADTDRPKFYGSLAALRGFLDCYDGSKECGMVCADGVYEKGTINGTKFIAEAKALGKGIR